MVKDHSDREREKKPATTAWATFSDLQQGLFYIHHPHRHDSTMPRPLVHQSWSTVWNEKELNGSTVDDRSDHPSHHQLF